VLAVADADKVVPETVETNNVKNSLLRVGPDLVISAFSTPLTVGAGATISVSTTTKNQGGGPAGASATKFYLSANTTLDATDILLESRAIGALSAGATNTGTTALRIPPATVAGHHYLLAVADAGKVVTETIEDNNSRSSVITVP
jgi:subtilase family serine protease